MMVLLFQHIERIVVMIASTMQKVLLKKIDKTHIHLQLDFYSQRGPIKVCKTIEDNNHHDLGIFTLMQTPNGYALIKTE